MTSSSGLFTAWAAIATTALLAGCSTFGSNAAHQPTPNSTSPPAASAQWLDWVDVDALVYPVGSSAETVLVAGMGTSLVIALDRETGQESWRLGDSADEAEWDESQAHGTVLYDETRVYTQRGQSDSALAAYDIASGEEVWRFDPGEVSACAPTANWQLSWSRTGSYDLGAGERLILSNPRMAAQECHDGPSATHPGSPAMLVVDAATGAVVGEPATVSGNSIPGLSSPDLTGRYVDTPYQLQGSVNIVRRDLQTGDETWAMLDYPDDFSVLDGPLAITDMGGDRFLVDYSMGGFVGAQVERWAEGFEDTGDVSTEDFGYGAPCEYRILRSGDGQLYCVTLTGSEFLLGEIGDDGRMAEDHPLTVPWAQGYDEYWGVVHDPQTVQDDPLIPADLLGRERAALALPGADGLSAIDLETGEPLWTWKTANGISGHVVAGVGEIVVGLGDRTVGLDAATGDQVWEVESDGPAFGAEDVIVIADYMSSTTQVRTTLPLS